jgi:hypothetical protein
MEPHGTRELSNDLAGKKKKSVLASLYRMIQK